MLFRSHGNFYAAQTFSNAPGGRRIQIGWGQGIAFPGMPFNQQMTFPCELTLRTTEDGVRMFAEPVKEIEKLHGKRHAWAGKVVKPGENLLAGIEGDLFEVRGDFEVKGVDAVEISIRGVPVVYDVKKQQLSCRGVTAPLTAPGGRVRLRLLIDRGSIEAFGNGGRVALSVGVIPADDNRSLGLSARGSLRVRSLEVFELKSAWAKP